MFDRGVGVVAASKWAAHGGIEAYARTLAEMLPDAAPRRHVELIDSRGSGTVASSALMARDAARRIRDLASQGRIDVLHLQVSERASFLRKGYLIRVGRTAGLRTILHHHGADLISHFEASPSPFKAWVRATVHSADMNIVLSSAIGAWLTERLGLPTSRWEVVFNGIPDLPAAPRPLPQLGRGPFRPLMLAVLSDRKGVGDFLQALARLRQAGQAFAATVAGGGPRYGHFVRMAADLGIGDACAFPGWIDPGNVPGYLNDHDTYVLPSKREGMPIGILEAMRQARPVIATAVGAIPEALPPGPGIALLEPGDVDALTAVLAQYAADPAVRRRKGNEARQRYLDHFTFDAHLEKLFDIYSDNVQTRVIQQRALGA